MLYARSRLIHLTALATRQLLVTVVRATFRFHDTTPQGLSWLPRSTVGFLTFCCQVGCWTDSGRYASLSSARNMANDILGYGNNRHVAGGLATSRQFFSCELFDCYLNGCVRTPIPASIRLFNDWSSVIFPYFLLPAFFIGFAYRELAIGYLNTGRDLRRMESNTRSPVFSYFSELLEGIVTVRAFSAERRFLDNLHRKIDTTTKVWLKLSNASALSKMSKL